MELESIAYNLPLPVILEGPLDKDRLDNAFKRLITRHDSFRTSFEMIEEEPVQRIHETVEFGIQYDDLIDGESPPDSTPVPVIESFIKPFDLAHPALLRVVLIKQEEEKHILLVDMHHIISDGVSHQVLINEFMAVYAGRKLPRLIFQYKDYSEWQTGELQKKVVQKQKDYWLKQLEGEIPILDLAGDYPRPSIQSFEGNQLNFELSPGQTRALNHLAVEEGATLYMLLLALYNVFLSKITGQEDILVGTAIAGRRHPDLEQIVGMFVNTLAIRNYPNGAKNFSEFLGEVNEKSIQDFENQDYPFEELVEQIVIQRDMSRSPLFDVFFALHNEEAQTSETAAINTTGLTLSSYPQYENRTAKFDISLACLETEGKLCCSFEYCTKLFKKETIENFVRYFMQIIDEVLDDKGKKISLIDILGDQEKNRLLYDINDTGIDVDYPREKLIHQLFEEQEEQSPDHVALVGNCQLSTGKEPFGQVLNAFGGMHLSYKELNDKSNQLAQRLREKGIRPDTIVGMILEPSIEMITAILGILKAGGAYLPLDPDYPQDRIDFMLKDSDAKIILTPKEIAAAIFSSSTLTSISTCQVSPTNLAYIIYTSGTTGSPKGVMIQHQNVVRLMINDKFRFEFNDSDIWTLFHSICFDFSVLEIYGALLYGGKSIIIPKMLTRDPDGFLDLLAVQKVTVLNQTPSAFYQLLTRSLNVPGKKLYLKYVIFGGEALNPARLNAWKKRYPGIRTVNMYGITETTVHVTYKEITEREMQLNTSNIGTPIADLTVYVMDRYLKLAPLGSAGELCVGGQGIARGYLNRPALTSEKFIQNPYKPDEKLYKSGDLVRLSRHGDMEYLGRIDQQVKIRGHRIEPGEVETQLLNHDSLKETLVVVKEDNSGDKYLCAYVVPGSKSTFNARGLKEYLAGKLPGYMIPSYVIPLERFHLTSNGKIDRKALPEPEIKAGETYAPPQNQVEEKLVEIWAQVLGIKTNLIGVDTNFFQLGGHSLNAASVISAVQENLGIRVPLIEIFRTPTVRQLARYIKNAEGKITATADKHLVLLRKSTEGAGHLFFIHDGSGDVEGYIEFCKDLDTRIHCWGIRAAPLENYTPLNLSIENISANYIKIIRKIQAHGPYYIAGWSLGGVIAFEMALQLETRGQNTAFLALIDAPAPQPDHNDDPVTFSVQTEVNFLMQYMPGNEIKEKVENISEINEIWPTIVNHLEKNSFSTDAIKKLIPDDLARIIPNYHRAGIKELVYYLNMNRTLTTPLSRYIPGGKIKMPVHYFKASESPGNINQQWQGFCSKSIRLYQVKGNHFSILKQPVVKNMVELFAKAFVI